MYACAVFFSSVFRYCLNVFCSGPVARRRHPLYEPALVSAGPPGDAGNLFAGAKVTASGHYGNDRPELAVDGQASNAGKYWGCEGIPVWLQIDMGSPAALSALHVWPYWEDVFTNIK